MAVMYIGKGHNMFYKWLDGKHIQLFHLCLIAICVHIDKRIFSKSFFAMHTVSGDNTANVSEYNDKSARESVENLN